MAHVFLRKCSLHLEIGGQWPAFHLSTSGRILQLGGIFRIPALTWTNQLAKTSWNKWPDCSGKLKPRLWSQGSTIHPTQLQKKTFPVWQIDLGNGWRTWWMRFGGVTLFPGRRKRLISVASVAFPVFLCVFSCCKRAPEPIGYFVERHGAPINGRTYMGFPGVISPLVPYLHSRKVTWNIKITQMKKENHLPNLHFWGFISVFSVGAYDWFSGPMKCVNFREDSTSVQKCELPLSLWPSKLTLHLQ